MRNLQQGFIDLALMTLAGLVLTGGSAVVYQSKVNATSGFSSYSNKVFSNFFPKNWTIQEEVLSSYGCSARVYFVQNPVPKQTLINEGTDYLHYLKNPGSVFTVSGGVGGTSGTSFESLKKYLIDREKDGRTIKLSFFQENVKETSHKLDLNSSSPSLTYYFEFPDHNKKGIGKSIVVDGKFPQTISVYYIALAKDFSESLFNSIVSSVKNNLTTNRCDPFEGSSVKKESKIKITLPKEKIWKEDNTYKISWSTDLPSTDYSYFYVQLGSDIPKRTASNPGSSGLWRVDKLKNSFEIKLNKSIINEQIINSADRNFDKIKDTFFVRVTAYNNQGTAFGQDDTVVAVADSALFSVAAPIITPSSNPQKDMVSLQSIANIVSSVSNLRGPAESVFDSNGGSYASICSGGLINVSAHKTFSILVDSILKAQEVSNQSSAGIICVTTKDKYALEVTFKKYVAPTGAPYDPFIAGKRSYCVDSSGASGYDTKHKLDKASFSCKP